METSRSSEANFKQSCKPASCQAPGSSSIKNISIEGITQALDATSLKQTTIVGTSRTQEAGHVKQKLKGGIVLPSEKGDIVLPEIPKPIDLDLPRKKVPKASSNEKKFTEVDSKSGSNYLDFDFF